MSLSSCWKQQPASCKSALNHHRCIQNYSSRVEQKLFIKHSKTCFRQSILLRNIVLGSFSFSHLLGSFLQGARNQKVAKACILPVVKQSSILYTDFITGIFRRNIIGRLIDFFRSFSPLWPNIIAKGRHFVTAVAPQTRDTINEGA